MNTGRASLKTILLADDEENLRMLVRTTLEDPDYEIVEVGNGEEAVTAATRHVPHLILLDWMMPGLTGPEVARTIRQNSALAQVPIILLTAKGQAEDRRAGLAAGATAYLVKPFSPSELLDTVQDLLDAGSAAGSHCEQEQR
jgi:two-component system phosphate regulon response regulator PhoB